MAVEMIPALPSAEEILSEPEPLGVDEGIVILDCGHGGSCLDFGGARPLPFTIQLLGASVNVRKGLLPCRTRPYLPLPGPDMLEYVVGEGVCIGRP
jgi:hypothetical protein